MEIKYQHIKGVNKAVTILKKGNNVFSAKYLEIFSESKLPIGVNVHVNGCLSLCVSPTSDW